MLNHYDPKEVLITFGEILLEGYADDTFVRIDPNADNAQLFMGVDGQGTRGIINDKSATISFILAASSKSNPLLSALAKLDRATGAGVRPLLVKDKSGTSLFVAPTAWIQREPTREYGAMPGTREWTIVTDELLPLDGEGQPPPQPT